VAIINRLVKKALNWAYSNTAVDRVKPIIKSLVIDGSLPIASAAAGPVFNTFQDSAGNEFKLVRGLRDRFKPSWRDVFSDKEPIIPDDKALNAKVRIARTSVDKTLLFLKNYGFHIDRKAALEIGCFDGARSYSLLSAGAGEVWGSDISRYYENPGQTDRAYYLEELRKKTKNVARSSLRLNNDVIFLEDDITDSQMPHERFDLISSWEVLEHVGSPGELCRIYIDC